MSVSRETEASGSIKTANYRMGGGATVFLVLRGSLEEEISVETKMEMFEGFLV